MASPLPEALAMLGAPLIEFQPETLRPWQQSIIYAWIRGTEVLYIGASSRGLARPVDPGHEKLRDLCAGDRLVVWAISEPWTLEMRLIQEIKPARNGAPGRARICPQCQSFRIFRRHYARGYCDGCADRLDPTLDGQALLAEAQRLEARAAELRGQARHHLRFARVLTRSDLC